MPRFDGRVDPRHRGATAVDTRIFGVGAGDSQESASTISPSTVSQTWATNTWDMMRTVKYTLLHYSQIRHTESLKDLKSWNIGYVFPQTILPAITIFPITKTFLPVAYSDGSQMVEYRLTIDIYSKPKKDIQSGINFCTNAVDDIKYILKGRPQLIYKDGRIHCFYNKIINQVMYDPEEEKRGFSVTATVLLACYSRHIINEDRESHPTIVDGDYQAFSEKLVELLKYEGTQNGWDIGSYVVNNTKKAIKYPVLSTVAKPEEINEMLTNRYANLTRPISIDISSRGYPKSSLIKNNLSLADKVVSGLEKHYNLDGYAQQFELDAINYVPAGNGMLFNSVIDVAYISRKHFESHYGM